MPDDMQAVWRRVTAPTARNWRCLTPLWLEAQSAAEEYELLARFGGAQRAPLICAAQAQRENALCLRGILRAQLCPLPRAAAVRSRALDEALRARLPECRESYRAFIALSPDAQFGPLFALMAERQVRVWEALLKALAAT